MSNELDDETLLALAKVIKTKNRLDKLEKEGKEFKKGFAKEAKAWGKAFKKELGAWGDTLKDMI